MSLLIKGMEMPKNCKECPFSDHEAWCLIPGSWKERYYCPDDERSDDCPLVEIPTPRGRLIDVEKIEYEKVYIDDVGKSYEMVGKDDIEEAPTVIEAEGEKK